MARALHDGLCARELDVGAQTLGEREVRAANQQESQLRLTQLLVELCVPTSSEIDLKGIFRLRTDTVLESVTFGERGNRHRPILSHVPRLVRSPPLFTRARID